MRHDPRLALVLVNSCYPVSCLISKIPTPNRKGLGDRGLQPTYSHTSCSDCARSASRWTSTLTTSSDHGLSLAASYSRRDIDVLPMCPVSSRHKPSSRSVLTIVPPCVTASTC